MSHTRSNMDIPTWVKKYTRGTLVNYCPTDVYIIRCQLFGPATWIHPSPAQFVL